MLSSLAIAALSWLSWLCIWETFGLALYTELVVWLAGFSISELNCVVCLVLGDWGWPFEFLGLVCLKRTSLFYKNILWYDRLLNSNQCSAAMTDSSIQRNWVINGDSNN